MKRNKILVTGGAGYIGSHIVKQLLAQGEDVIVLDDLSTGVREAVLGGELIVGDIGDKELVESIFNKHNIDSVIHLAASISVPESVENPFKYYQNNVVNMMSLLECCVIAKIKHFIFSSTSAVYGDITVKCVDETHSTNPVSPYGTTKLIGEQLIKDVTHQQGINFINLRYFNVSGADVNARIGSFNQNLKSITRAVLDTITEKSDYFSIFGTDYETRDGTAIRDYIHVDDIASAHLCSLDYLRKGREPLTLNVGYGKGYSVKEFVEAANKVSGEPINVKACPKRPGDPACVIADATQLRELLGWKPQFDNLETIIQSALTWEEKREDAEILL